MIDTAKAIEELVRYADIGVPFRHQGRSVEEGMDCVGVLISALAAAGYEFRCTPNFLRACYRRNPRPADLLAVVSAECAEIPREQVQPLDVFLIDYERGKSAPRHVATVTSVDVHGPVIVHTSYVFGRVVRHHLTPDWAALVTGTYRLRELM